MATYKKEYPYLMEDIVTPLDIYSADGHKFHTQRGRCGAVSAKLLY